MGWMITESEQAEQVVRDQHADRVTLARGLLRDLYWPYHVAVKNGDEKGFSLLPVQYARAARR
jgi:2,4-dienoyl-CoA reductase-like NADH-dependent reductase (Old Yellow Enzyme family)